MHIKFTFVTLLTFCLFFTLASAHVEESSFNVNGASTIVLPKDPLESEHVANDKAPQVYEVNQKIDFEIKDSAFHYSPPIMKDITLIWDFGDGSVAERLLYGKKNSHTYAQAGTYRVTVTLDYSSSPRFGGGSLMLIQVVTLTIKEPAPTPATVIEKPIEESVVATPTSSIATEQVSQTASSATTTPSTSTDTSFYKRIVNFFDYLVEYVRLAFTGVFTP